MITKPEKELIERINAWMGQPIANEARDKQVAILLLDEARKVLSSAHRERAALMQLVEKMLWAVMDREDDRFVLPATSDGRFVPAEYLRELSAHLSARGTDARPRPSTRDKVSSSVHSEARQAP